MIVLARFSTPRLGKIEGVPWNMLGCVCIFDVFKALFSRQQYQRLKKKKKRLVLKPSNTFSKLGLKFYILYAI